MTPTPPPPRDLPDSAAVIGRPLALLGETSTLLTLLLTTLCLLAVWLLESSSGVIRPLDRWLYPAMCLLSAAGAVGVGLRKLSAVQGQRVLASLTCAYFLVAIVYDVVSGRGTQLYDAATAGPWMMVAHLLLFISFPPARALIGSGLLMAGLGLEALNLDPSQAPDRAVLALLVNAMIANTFVVALMFVLMRQLTQLARSDAGPASVDDGPVTVRDLLLHRAQERRELEVRTAEADSARLGHEREMLGLFEAFPGYVVRIDAQARFSLVNERMARLYGLTPETMVGRPVVDLVGAERWQEIVQSQERVRASGLPSTFERVMVDSTGRERHLLATQFAVPDAQGRPTAAFYQVGLDITDMRQAQRALDLSRAQLDALFASLPQPTLMKDRDGRLVRVNDAYCELLNLRPDQVIGHHISEFTNPSHMPAHEATDLAARQTRQVQRYAISRQKPDGTTLDMLLSKAAVFMASGEFIGTVSSLFDVTEMNRAQRLMREAREDAEAANAAKSTFLATMSHEIRTPMNGVIGMAEILLHSPLPAEQAQSVTTIRDSAQRLLRLLDSILDFSKIESGRLELETAPVDLRASLAETIAVLQPMAVEKGVRVRHTVEGRVPARMLGDDVRLRQILSNLLSNAIKFSARPDGQGAVEVRVDVTDTPMTASAAAGAEVWHAGRSWTRQQLTVHVSDNGIGMDPAALGRLFQPFRQAEVSTTRRFGGTGLGLAITQRLVDMLGGRILVRSEPGKGSVFTVRMPLRLVAEAAAEAAVDPSAAGGEASVARVVPGATNPPTAPVARAAPEAPAAPVQPSRADAPPPAVTTPASVLMVPPPADAAVRAPASRTPRRYLILVAEDEPVNRMVLTRQLELLGHDAEVAHDGEEALRLWHAGEHDLVLTDLHMPGMDGYALARAIRAEAYPRAGVPILALTANAQRGEADKAREAGMNEFLTKPIRMHELQAALERWLGDSAGRDALPTGEGALTQP